MVHILAEVTKTECVQDFLNLERLSHSLSSFVITLINNVSALLTWLNPNAQTEAKLHNARCKLELLSGCYCCC